MTIENTFQKWFKLYIATGGGYPIIKGILTTPPKLPPPRNKGLNKALLRKIDG